MKKILVVAVLMGLTASLYAADASGIWDLQMIWQESASTGRCTFRQDKEKLSGACGGNSDQFSITGEVRGMQVTWQVNVEQNGGPGTMTFSGVLDESGTSIK